MTTRKRVNGKRIHTHSNDDGNHLLISAAAGALIGAIAIWAFARKEKISVASYTDAVSDYLNPPKASRSHPLLILGAIAGSILGASLLYFHQEKKSTQKHGFVDNLWEAGKSASKNFQSLDWADIAKEFAETIRERVNPEAEEEEIEIPRPKRNQEHFQDAIDWAVIGLRLWNNFKK